MKLLHVFCLLLVAGVVVGATAMAQEFPVAVGGDSTWSGGAVYGGLNGIVAVQGSAASQYTINAQIISAPGQVSGGLIPLNAYGIPPGATPIFDGTNYFLIWLEFSGTVKGQFLSTSGELVGSPITIATGVTYSRNSSYNIAVGTGSFLVAFIKEDGYLYGQIVTPAGTLSGNQFKISSSLARDFCLEFDGTNYLVAWVEVIPDTDRDVIGQLVSGTGTLVGTNFLINGTPSYSDNPTWMAFDGSRYLVVYHEKLPGTAHWSINGTFITKAGAVEESFTLCDTSKAPTNPTVAFDGHNYLVTWTQTIDLTLMGCFFTPAGTPVNSPFVIFDAVENKLPFGGVGFGGGLYLAVATRVDFTMTNGDVYARFIQPLTGIETPRSSLPQSAELTQNYPNPFNPSTEIRYQIPEIGYLKLAVYDLLGREVAVIVDGKREPGAYSVTWNASGMPSGVYLCRLQAGSVVQVRKMVLVK